MDVVEKAKLMLGDKAQGVDVDLLYLVLKGHVLSCLNRDDIPTGLEPIMAYMLTDYAQAVISTSGSASVGSGKITSIRRGDTTIEYDANGAADTGLPLQAVLSKWMPNLSRWAKARGIRRA